jgi:hypothetical protein
MERAYGFPLRQTDDGHDPDVARDLGTRSQALSSRRRGGDEQHDGYARCDDQTLPFRVHVISLSEIADGASFLDFSRSRW